MNDDVVLDKFIYGRVYRALTHAANLLTSMKIHGTLLDANLAELYVEARESCAQAISDLDFRE